ncbi:hypothetical protein OG524_29430 [Streptomyces sp. NBC_01520]|uniref:hypothetical protein n=1 Tax=Streptomyces sp. NBC_01520 TaxID=2903892 RepID=UPI00386826F9
MKDVEGMQISSPNYSEERLLEAFVALRECPEISVSMDEVSVLSEAEGDEGVSASYIAAEMLEDAARVPALARVGSGLRIAEEAPRFRKIASRWRGFAAHGELTGEFSVPNFCRTIFEPAPPLTWEGSSEEERRLFAEFRKIDSNPRSGTGLFSVVRLEQAANPLGIWVWDARAGALQMDVDYLGYLEALSLTKGTHGWQYLFTDVSLENPDFYHVANGMKRMLQVFPQYFPQHGYEDLERRLEERL